MAVRRQRACYSTLSVTKWFGEKPRRTGITLHRENTFIQNKSLLYSKMKSIENGKLKLPIPLNRITHRIRIYSFQVNTDGSLKFLC